MKSLTFLAIFFALSAFADNVGMERFSPHFSTNTPIIWEVPTNLPASFWIYRRLPPRPFSPAVIAAAMKLASLQGKAVPAPFTNDFFIAADHPSNYPCSIPVIFQLIPQSATISHYALHPGTNIYDLFADPASLRLAQTCAVKLGIDLSQTLLREPVSYFNHDNNGDDIPGQLSGRGFTFSRQLDGIPFAAFGDDNGVSEGFWISFGDHERIRAFSFVWLELERERLEPAATPSQIIACIRAFQTVPTPLRHETNFLERIKTIASANKFSIVKITPCYGESPYGTTPVGDNPSPVIAPFAELEATAYFDDHHETVHLLSPVTAVDAIRLSSRK